MASKEEELKELAELEELAQLEALAAKERTAPVGQELGALEIATRGLNYPGGAVRGGLAKAMSPIIGDIVTTEQIRTGTVPSTKELAEKAGIDVLDFSPALLRNLAKLTGQEDLARSLVGGTVDVALDPTTYAPGLNLIKATKPIAKGAVSFGKILLDPLGTSLGVAGKGVSAGAKGLGKLGTAVAGKLSQFTPEEAQQYLKNKQAVKGFTELLSDKTNIDIAQEKAFQAISKMRDTIRNAGLAADKEMGEILEGKNVQVNINRIKQMAENLPEKQKKEVDAIVSRAEKDLEAYRPFQPEFETTTARQKGVEGLTHQYKAPEIIPSEVSLASEEQPLLFAETKVAKPEYKEIPQPPKAPDESLLSGYKRVEPTEAELEAYYKYKKMYDAFSPRAKNARTYRYNKDISTKPIEPDELLRPTAAKTPEEELLDLQKYLDAEAAVKRYEETFPQLKQAKEPEFLFTPTTVQKVEGRIIPGEPGYSEYFPAEASRFSELLQEPLQLPARGTRPEAATIPAPMARSLKQIFQEEAKYGKSVPVTAKGAPRYTEYDDIANEINQELRKEAQVQALDDYMRQGIVAQQALQQGEKAPLQFLKTQSEDVTAMLARAAKRTGDKEVFDLANQLSAARKIMGKGDYDDWVSRAGIRKVGRGALTAIDKFSKTGKATKQMIDDVTKDVNVPPQIWLKMLQSRQEGEK